MSEYFGDKLPGTYRMPVCIWYADGKEWKRIEHSKYQGRKCEEKEEMGEKKVNLVRCALTCHDYYSYSRSG